MQVQIRHLGGEDVSLDDCASFSIPMGEAIEASELITQAYVLEISSPGITEELNTDREFQTFKGFPVEVLTFDKESQSQVHLAGLLNEKSKDELQINIKGRLKTIPINSVISVKLTTSTG